MLCRNLRLLLLVALLFLLSTSTAWARHCSQETLNGTYVAFEQGQFVTEIPNPITNSPPPLFPLGPFINSAKATFDGKGNVSGTYVAVIGDGRVRRGEFSGTYLVGADCTYSDAFTVTTGVPVPVPLFHEGFITGEGILQEVHYVYVVPKGTTPQQLPDVVSGTLKRE